MCLSRTRSHLGVCYYSIKLFFQVNSSVVVPIYVFKIKISKKSIVVENMIVEVNLPLSFITILDKTFIFNRTALAYSTICQYRLFELKRWNLKYLLGDQLFIKSNSWWNLILFNNVNIYGKFMPYIAYSWAIVKWEGEMGQPSSDLGDISSLTEYALVDLVVHSWAGKYYYLYLGTNVFQRFLEVNRG